MPMQMGALNLDGKAAPFPIESMTSGLGLAPLPSWRTRDWVMFWRISKASKTLTHRKTSPRMMSGLSRAIQVLGTITHQLERQAAAEPRHGPAFSSGKASETISFKNPFALRALQDARLGETRTFRTAPWPGFCQRATPMALPRG